MKVDNPIGKTKHWRRLLNPPELAAFALKYQRHRLRVPWVRPALERLFMNRVKDGYRARMRTVETIPVMAEAPELCAAQTHERSVVSSFSYRDGDN